VILGRYGAATTGSASILITGELRSKADAVRNAFWSGGITSPIEVIEQIAYLLFLRGLDQAQTREENKANRFGTPMERIIFQSVNYPRGRPCSDLRWGKFKDNAPAEMFTIVSDHVFLFLREMAEDGLAEHMKGARFTIPTPALLARVVDMLDEIPLEDRDTKGDLYEYMLASRTPSFSTRAPSPTSPHPARSRSSQ